jgi:hypothetical protein
VYELDGGISVKSSAGIEIAPGSTGGVLFYVPGYTIAPDCATATSVAAEGSVTLGAQGVLGLPPLTEAQSIAAFSGNPSLAGVWLWQDATNANGVAFGAGSSSTGVGLAYVPSAIVSLSGSGQAYVGELICSGISLGGAGNGNGLNITGTV